MKAGTLALLVSIGGWVAVLASDGVGATSAAVLEGLALVAGIAGVRSGSDSTRFQAIAAIAIAAVYWAFYIADKA